MTNDTRPPSGQSLDVGSGRLVVTRPPTGPLQGPGKGSLRISKGETEGVFSLGGLARQDARLYC
jgi:hypothetical protein